ncbi:MAG: hypothetical protein UR28_C0002G0047 [Candidatus Peregrinibacteria bacterium GW2011_GWF2_33_10]|nr:MAG: hypothetical protein UR28_C0002G0047 [Candidatus Peregrinibacteria bacterium GW2011_GWF2_33_10]OGJ45624.1 MAG: hypothetical protein A2263_00805 [Candidatus Peregrinibacteria bacterium RIFOXYA2_FULL_33_21]OGJ46579.1 MAG: hypothetical protein A2272_06500 [Candidatus Peregrinibacteria bacterium RIFOXYA12_FULL_33_12]OGJ51215.1 MAG: hypothetical protein A2307_01185 [Candidatus Peregrinibacteria bacterium RIFOXYB2_FULL_33_20]
MAHLVAEMLDVNPGITRIFPDINRMVPAEIVRLGYAPEFEWKKTQVLPQNIAEVRIAIKSVAEKMIREGKLIPFDIDLFSCKLGWLSGVITEHVTTSEELKQLATDAGFKISKFNFAQSTDNVCFSLLDYCRRERNLDLFNAFLIGVFNKHPAFVTLL